MTINLRNIALSLGLASIATMALADRGVVVAPQSNYDNEYPISGNVLYAGSESLYTAAELSAATGGVEEFTITQLEYFLREGKDFSGLEVTAYYAITDKTDLSSGFNESELTEVFNGALSGTSDSDIVAIKLDTPITMHAGENLVIGLKSHYTTYTWLYFAYTKESTGLVRVFSDYYNPITLTATGGSMYNEHPALAIEFVEGTGGDLPGQDEVTDLSAVSLSGVLAASAGVNYDYTVKVENAGTVKVDSYKVEVVAKSEDASETVLGSTNVDTPLIKGMSQDVVVKVAFPESGEYEIMGRVVCDADAVETNDVTESLNVVVNTIDIKADALTAPESVNVGETAEIKIGVKNEGSTANSDYSVELQQVDASGNVIATLATIADVPVVDAKSVSDVVIEHTFALGGEYMLRGAVKVDGFDDTYTPVVTVNAEFEKYSGVHEIIVPDNGTSTVCLDGITRGYYKTFSQIVYDASYFDNVERNAQIQKIGFTSIDDTFYSVNIPAKVYAASADQSGALSQNTLVPADQFTLVYDGQIAIKGGDAEMVWVEFCAPFILEKGKSLVLNIECYGEQNGWSPTWKAINTSEVKIVRARTNNESVAETLTVYNASAVNNLRYVPLLNVEYALAPLPPMADLAVTAINVPDPVFAKTEATFRADIRNEGTVDVAQYTLQLLDVTDPDNVIVLASTDIDNPLGAGGEAYNQKVKYTFGKDGNYKIAMRVVAEGDVNEDNNMSEIVDLKVDKDMSVEAVTTVKGYVAYANGVLYVSEGCESIAIYDAAGRLLFNSEVQNGFVNVNLASGVYIVSAKYGDANAVASKIIVK